MLEGRPGTIDPGARHDHEVRHTAAVGCTADSRPLTRVAKHVAGVVCSVCVPPLPLESIQSYSGICCSGLKGLRVNPLTPINGI